MRMLSRIAGLAGGAALATVAAQLLTIGFEAEPVLDPATVADLQAWLVRRPRTGAALLGGVVLCLAGVAALAGTLLVRVRRGPVVPLGRAADGGRTVVDAPAAASAVARAVRELDSRVEASARLTRRGRLVLRIRTPEPGLAGHLADIRDHVERICTERGIPCRRVVLSVRTRRASGRVR